MDYFEAAINPCSIETIQEPVRVSKNTAVWPVMLGCYELQENGSRHGRMDLFTIRVPDISMGKNLSMNLRFGNATPVLAPKETTMSGILDGKWIKNKGIKPSFYFATAHSSGQVSIHYCNLNTAENNISSDCVSEEMEPLLKMQLIAKSEALRSSNGRAPLCLSLNWDNATLDDSARIVSTYSDGRVAIHDVVKTQSTSPGPTRVEIVEQASWEAHTLFTVPAEVWSAGFIGETENGDGSINTVMSGGDDGSLKVWDIRSLNRPTQVLKNHFDAGVTVVAPHPRRPNLVACGSYDETINLYDIRYLSTNARPLGRSGPLGGGIWRLKWHPFDDNRLLVAAMHGGCRIVKIDKLHENDTPVLVATKEFVEHKSMAYGADWLVCKHPKEDGYFEAAASCSFYDKAVYLWDTVA